MQVVSDWRIPVARYINRTCPCCQHLLDDHIPVWDYSLILGQKRMTCPKCGKQLLTGQRYWAELSGKWKSRVVLGLLILILMFGVMFFLLLVFGVGFIWQRLLGVAMTDEVASLVLLPLSLILSVAYHVRRLKKLTVPPAEDHAATKK